MSRADLGWKGRGYVRNQSEVDLVPSLQGSYGRDNQGGSKNGVLGTNSKDRTCCRALQRLSAKWEY